MELDIRAETEAAAAELEAQGLSFDDDGQQGEAAAPDSGSDESTAEAGKPADGGDPPTEGTQAAATPGDSASDADEDDFELPAGGSIPVPRVLKIIENARKKAAAKALKELQATQPQETEEQRAARAEAEQFFRFANENPVEFARRVTSRLRQDPTYAPEINRLFEPAAPERPTQPEDEKPEPDVFLNDGRLVYSSERIGKLLEWQQRQLTKQFDQRLAPVVQTEAQRRHAAEIDAAATRVYNDAVTWPGMDSEDNRKAVAAHMRQHNTDIHAAYRAAVVPKLATDVKAIEARVRQQVLADLKRKGTASTTRPHQAPAPDPATTAGKSIREIVAMTAEELGYDGND